MVGSSTHEQTRQRTMTIVGIYDVVCHQWKTTIYMSLVEAQQLFGMDGQVTEVVISLKQIGQEAGVITAINKSVPGYEVDSWETSIPDLKQVIEMKTSVVSIFGVFMLGIAAIGILNLLMMAVFERTREIGVIGALGLKPRQITLIFLRRDLIGDGRGHRRDFRTIVNGALGYYGLITAFAI